MAKKAPIKGKAAQTRVSAKISKLHKEEPGMPHKQHIGMALEMERKHKLGPKGGYKRKGKK